MLGTTLVLLAGCAPMTLYRQSLVVPPPAPPLAAGAPLADGETAFGAAFSETAAGAPVSWLVTEEGDPGLWVPTREGSAWERVGVDDFLEVGLSARWASRAVPSSLGVLPIPGGEDLFGLGAHLTVGVPARPLGVGATLEATFPTLPFARYQLVDGEDYVLVGSGTVHPLLVRASVAATWRWRALELGGGWAVASQLTNTGFTDDKDVPAWESATPAAMPMVSVGLGGGSLRVAAQGWWALGAVGPSDGLIPGPGARLIVEARIGAAERAPAEPPPMTEAAPSWLVALPPPAGTPMHPVLLSSRPAGCLAFVDGRHVGHTPVTVEVPAGAHEAIVQCGGQRSRPLSVDVRGGETLEWRSAADAWQVGG